MTRSPAEAALKRWRYPRGLAADQLALFERGALQLHADGVNVSARAIARLKGDLLQFDRLIAGARPG